VEQHARVSQLRQRDICAVASAPPFFVIVSLTIVALFDSFVLGPSPEVRKLDAYTFSLCLRSTYLPTSDNFLACCLVLVTFCRSMCRNGFVKDMFKVDRASWTHSHTASTFSIRTLSFSALGLPRRIVLFHVMEQQRISEGRLLAS